MERLQIPELNVTQAQGSTAAAHHVRLRSQSGEGCGHRRRHRQQQRRQLRQGWHRWIARSRSVAQRRARKPSTPRSERHRLSALTSGAARLDPSWMPVCDSVDLRSKAA